MENISQIPIRKIMIKDVVCVTQGTSLQEAAEIMLAHRVGCLVVMQGEKPVGIVTERHFVNLIRDAESSSKWLIVDDVMPEQLITIIPSTSIAKAFSMLNTYGIKRLPVVSNNRLKGLLTVRQMLIYSRNTLLDILVKNRLLEKEVNRDELTGVFNKRYLMNRLHHEYNWSIKYGVRTCVAFMDIDSFKTVNDTFSHSAGDYVLRNIGKILRKNIRAQDIAARFGGEEFVVIFPSTKAFEAAYLANKIRYAIEQHPFVYKKKRLNITLSAGVAPFTSGRSLAKVMDMADEALYLAKNAGKNQVFRWSETASKLVYAPYNER